MKQMLWMTLMALAVVSCGVVDDEYYQRVQSTIPEKEEPEPDPDDPAGDVTVDPTSYWYIAADSASMELLRRYWPPMLTHVAAAADDLAHWHFAAQQDGKSDPNNNYWHQPHALDAVIDAYNRTPTTAEYAARKREWLAVFDKWFQGVPRFQYQWNNDWTAAQWAGRYPWAATDGADGWRNHYIDDMEWQVLTHIRMYEALRENEPTLAAKYLTKAREIYDKFIWTLAWDDESRGGDGGVFWMRTNNDTTNSKNACSNGPAMTIAAKLAFYTTGDEKAEYTRQAVAIYEWMMAHLWNSNGAISDSWNNGARQGGALTYNQGTFVGGCHWLYKVTGNDAYLQSAVKAVEYTLANMQGAAADGTRLLNSESGATEGNNSVFRAIFLRYFAEMINETAVDAGVRAEWYDHLERWADYVWRDGRGIDKGTGVTGPGQMLFGYDWRKQLTESEIAAGVNLGNAVSGAVLVEAMNIAVDPAR